ncbi:MAG: hypothetical protein JWQ00_3119, partial [Noviherbaspirillum sp.]|nr:hypothetical protein [Noviherbaspirillum sp.]
MRNRFLANPRHRMLRLLLACIMCVDAALVSAAAGTADDAGAAALRAKYAELEARLADNQF